MENVIDIIISIKMKHQNFILNYLYRFIYWSNNIESICLIYHYLGQNLTSSTIFKLLNVPLH